MTVIRTAIPRAVAMMENRDKNETYLFLHLALMYLEAINNEIDLFII